MLMNIAGLIPAAILLVLHFLFDIPVFWAIGAAALWLSVLIFRMLFLGWATKCGNEPTPYRANKNPYSVGQPNEMNNKHKK